MRGGGALRCLDRKRAPRAQKVEKEARGNRPWGEGELIMGRGGIDHGGEGIDDFSGGVDHAA